MLRRSFFMQYIFCSNFVTLIIEKLMMNWMQFESIASTKTDFISSIFYQILLWLRRYSQRLLRCIDSKKNEIIFAKSFFSAKNQISVLLKISYINDSVLNLMSIWISNWKFELTQVLNEKWIFWNNRIIVTVE
jgi:hypothetical protein